MHIRRVVLAVALVVTVAAALTVFVSSPSRAADQTVLGKSFVVKDPQPGVDASLRSIVALGKEFTSDDFLMGNPISNGATVEIIANGANPTSQTFTLPPGPAVSPAPGWKSMGNPVSGYSYKDADGVNGPVKAAVIKKGSTGTFVVKVTIKGALGPGPQPHITVVPPAPGTNGGMRFTINAGDSYCVVLGGAAGGKLVNAPSNGTPNKTFKLVGNPDFPTTETGCPSPETTTSTSSSTTSSSTSSSSTSVTSTTTSSSTTSTTPPGIVLQGALTATTGRFNYNLVLGIPGSDAACNTNFPGTHTCTYANLQSAEAAGDLDGLKDTGNNTVTSFWAIDSSHADTLQCHQTVAWDYATAHTGHFGEMVTLNNGTGALGPLMSGSGQGVFCAGSSWVGCCL